MQRSKRTVSNLIKPIKRRHLAGHSTGVTQLAKQSEQLKQIVRDGSGDSTGSLEETLLPERTSTGGLNKLEITHSIIALDLEKLENG